MTALFALLLDLCCSGISSVRALGPIERARFAREGVVCGPPGYAAELVPPSNSCRMADVGTRTRLPIRIERSSPERTARYARVLPMCSTLAASSTEHVGWPIISPTSRAVAFTLFL